MFKPLVITEGGLIRLLRRYGKHMGQSDVMSNATAQVFLQVDEGAQRWDLWLRNNCGRCVHSPDACRMFHPTEDQCQGDLTPQKLRDAHLLVIETGRVTECPLRSESG